MSRKNKGSVLIISVVVFSIITTVCMSCAGLILSNSRIYKLDYMNEKLKEGNIGIIEIIRSNILKEVKIAIDNTNNRNEFYSYMTKNNSREFINKIKNISDSSVNNSEVTISYNTSSSNKDYMHYTISAKYIIKNYDKYVVAKFKIKNPWNEVKIKDEDEDNVGNEGYEFEDINENEEIIVQNEEDEENKINESDLVIFYNYEEK